MSVEAPPVYAYSIHSNICNVMQNCIYIYMYLDKPLNSDMEVHAVLEFCKCCEGDIIELE